VARGIQSIVLGFKLVEVIAEAGVPLSLKAISALSGMSPSKARMYLISFIETGLVTQNPEPTWRHLHAELAALGLTRAEQKQRVKELESLTADVRKRRIALTDPISYASGVTVSGYAALAAPVFDVVQRLRYAITLVYQTGRDKRRGNKFSRLTQRAAERLSHLAGAAASGREG